MSPPLELRAARRLPASSPGPRASATAANCGVFCGRRPRAPPGLDVQDVLNNKTFVTRRAMPAKKSRSAAGHRLPAVSERGRRPPTPAEAGGDRSDPGIDQPLGDASSAVEGRSVPAWSRLAESSDVSFIAAVTRDIEGLLHQTEADELVEVASHLCLAPGAKRARPKMVSELGAALAVDPGLLRPIAVATELIHSASLLHDDVVDAGTIRRGRPTANQLYGNASAVLAGDLLITLAFRALRQHPAALTAEAIETIGAMTMAARKELGFRRDVHVTVDDWRVIAAGKTGALFRYVGFAVGFLAGGEPLARGLATACLHLGIAFQMVDDLIDVAGNDGKGAWSDLRNGNPNLVHIAAMMGDPELRTRLAADWRQGGSPDSTDSPSPLELAARAEEIARLGVVPVATDLRHELLGARGGLGGSGHDNAARVIRDWAARIEDALPKSVQTGRMQ